MLFQPFTLPFLTRHGCHQFSTSLALANRAIIYSQTGNPATVLTALTYPSLSPPQPNTLNIRFLLSPINPADINVIEGVYPSKPSTTTSLAVSGKGSKDQPVFIGGNEGLAEVTQVGRGVSAMEKGDWVVMTKQQMGTWSTSKNVRVDEVLKVHKAEGLSQVHGATMTVNPPTAYNMLHDFVHLEQDDWVVQNGANSAVGQAVIQIAASRGLKTLNFVRNRKALKHLTDQLETLGATRVLTYDDLSDRSLRERVKEWTGGKQIRLGLNCVGGRDTTLMTQLLGRDAHLVSYGAMSKQPLSFPTSSFIFKNLTAHGFWQSRWYADQTQEEKEKVMQALVELMSQGKLKEPEHEIVTIGVHESDEEAGQKIRNIITKMSEGQYGKKVLLKLEGAHE